MQEEGSFMLPQENTNVSFQFLNEIMETLPLYDFFLILAPILVDESTIGLRREV
jgi:hypothetical protein